MVAAGTVAATLTFAGKRPLTLAIRDAGGKVLARRTGTSPLGVKAQAAAGTIALQVTGSRDRQAFDLALTYPQAAAATTESTSPGQPAPPPVLLSTIAEAAPMSAAGRPQLGAPPVAASASVVALGFAVSDEPSAAFVRAINGLRRARHLGPVAASAPLARAALAHARALAGSGQFTHDWDDGTPFSTWIVRYYPPRAGSWLAGENLLWASAPVTPAAAIAAWLGSPSHRRILLTSSWRDVGVGVVAVKEAPGVYGGGDAYIVAADFGSRS